MHAASPPADPRGIAGTVRYHVVVLRGMRVLFVLTAAGCASTVAPSPAAAPTAPRVAGVPELLLGLPPAVLVERALLDLDSGEPARAARARCILLSVEDSAALEPLRARARTAPRGSAARLEAVNLLLERGESPAAFTAEEVVAAGVRELARGDPAPRAALLALERIRSLGEAALPALRATASAGGSAGEAAARVLAALFGEEWPLAGLRP